MEFVERSGYRAGGGMAGIGMAGTASPDIGTAGAETSPRRRRDKEATKQALLSAAGAVFAERGYDAATTREVAQQAGVNEQLIQRYFGGKEGLLLTLIRQFGEAEQRACGEQPPAASVEAEILGFLTHRLEHTGAACNVSKVALARALCDRSMAEEIRRQFTSTRVPLLRRRLEALRARGLIDGAADLDSAATALSSLSFGLAFVDQLVFGADCARLRQLAQHVAEIYAAGLAPKP